MNIHNKLSILYICRGPFGFLGGTATYMFPKTVAEMGHQVKVICFSDSFGESESVHTSDFKDNFTIEEYQALPFFKRAKIVRDCIVEQQPDIVHVFITPKYYILPFFCKLSGQNVPKWLIDVRSPPLRKTPLKEMSLFSKFKENLRFFHQMGFDVITANVASSAHLHFFRVLKPLSEVHFGVNFLKIKKKNWGQRSHESETIKFIYIGSLAKLRKIDVLIEAINIVKAHSTKKFQVDFFGAGDYVEEIKSLLDGTPLGNTVRYKGVIPQDQLFEKLCEYDVGIGYVPYEQYMGAPALKVLEYMAANLLVIASDTEGIKRQISHNRNGMLFQNTPESISKTMIDVLQKDVPLNIVRNGYNQAAKNSWDIIIKNQLLKVYERLLR